ncbi:MAG: type V CRISPR-associated endonuclease Cas1 [Helicobacteraceae bacterium]|jgi:CRISPR-associated protein Cas1|nr:type V CRISPR-associated endonuclease Cas1 [Helicobacteraceae bacterium]
MIGIKDFREKQIIFAFMNDGDKISFKNDNIIITDREGAIKHQSTCYLLFALFVVGNITITSGILSRAQKFNFTIVLMTMNLRVYCILNSKAEGNTLLRRKQYIYNNMKLGAQIVENKMINQRAALINLREKSENALNAIATIENLLDYLKKLPVDREYDRALLSEIMGAEGLGAKAYFAAIYEDHNWIARRPRVKEDITNCLLDIGYTLLFNLINALLELHGFDLFVGVLHREFYHRRSLACDLTEPFRVLVDLALLRALNLQQINAKNFIFQQNQYRIFGKDATPYIEMFIIALLDRKDDIFLFTRNYYRSFARNEEIKPFLLKQK